MANTDTIKASLGDFSLADLQDLQEALHAEIRLKAHAALSEQEEEMNNLRKLAGLKARPKPKSTTPRARRPRSRETSAPASTTASTPASAKKDDAPKATGKASNGKGKGKETTASTETAKDQTAS